MNVYCSKRFSSRSRRTQPNEAKRDGSVIKFPNHKEGISLVARAERSNLPLPLVPKLYLGTPLVSRETSFRADSFHMVRNPNGVAII